MSGWLDHLVLRRPRPLDAIAKSADTVTFSLRISTVTIRNLDAGVHAGLLALDTGSISVGHAVRTAREVLPAADVQRLLRELGRLFVRGAFSIAVEDGEETLCELEPSSASAVARFGLSLDEWDRCYRLSRLVLIRRHENGLVVEGLATTTRMAIHRTELTAVLGALHEPADETTAARQAPELPGPVLTACLRLMQAGGLIGRVDDEGLLPEDRDPDLMMRDPHDLFLHNRSRVGLTTDAIGGTFRFAGVRPPLPAIHPPWTGRPVALPEVDLDRLTRTDPPLAAAMERRRSRREWADRPLTLEELGEFLFRVFRIKSLMPADPADPQSYEAALRPIPSAGASGDIEVYIAAARISGIGRGLFHYDPARHVLTEVTGAGLPVTTIIQMARQSAGVPAEPPALIVLASRFGRLAWKYEGLSYAATLKNVGVAYAAMYLAATAMDLAACGLGAGESAAFANATKLAPHVESSVGEFMIGPAVPE